MELEEREQKIREEADVFEGDDGFWYAYYQNHKVRDLTAYSALDTLINRIMFGDDDNMSFA